MPQFVESLTVGHGAGHYRSYHEFDVDTDGPVLAEAMLKEYGTKEACMEEMVYLTIVAAAKDDRTTLNGLGCLRKYWRGLDR